MTPDQFVISAKKLIQERSHYINEELKQGEHGDFYASQKAGEKVASLETDIANLVADYVKERDQLDRSKQIDKAITYLSGRTYRNPKESFKVAAACLAKSRDKVRSLEMQIFSAYAAIDWAMNGRKLSFPDQADKSLRIANRIHRIALREIERIHNSDPLISVN